MNKIFICLIVVILSFTVLVACDSRKKVNDDSSSGKVVYSSKFEDDGYSQSANSFESSDGDSQNDTSFIESSSQDSSSALQTSINSGSNETSDDWTPYY